MRGAYRGYMGILRGITKSTEHPSIELRVSRKILGPRWHTELARIIPKKSD